MILEAGDAHVRDSDLVFHESFEGPASVRANGGAVAGGAFVRGLTGSGYVALANTKANIRYRSIENNFPVNEGTIEFWVRPNWGTETARSHQFVRAGAFLVIERHESEVRSEEARGSAKAGSHIEHTCVCSDARKLSELCRGFSAPDVKLVDRR